MDPIPGSPATSLKDFQEKHQVRQQPSQRSWPPPPPPTAQNIFSRIYGTESAFRGRGYSPPPTVSNPQSFALSRGRGCFPPPTVSNLQRSVLSRGRGYSPPPTESSSQSCGLPRPTLEQVLQPKLRSVSASLGRPRPPRASKDVGSCTPPRAETSNPTRPPPAPKQERRKRPYSGDSQASSPEKFEESGDSFSSSLAGSPAITPSVSSQAIVREEPQSSFAPKGIENLSPFISHCSFLPLDYEFSQEELVSLWIAEGLVPVADRSSSLEDVADEAFRSLVSNGFIVPSRFDRTLDYLNPTVRRQLYKVHQSLPMEQHASVSDGGVGDVPETVLHLSMLCESLDQIKALKRFKDLRTLFLIPSFGFSVERIPFDLFLWVKHLRALNLSRSILSELPVSIGNLKSLRYLDLSYTLIKQLPDTIDTLKELQTLKLRCCFNLAGLPKGMSKLTKLRHLDVDVIRQINSMPPGMGNLVELQTLSAFLVGRNDGCGIEELKNMINLTGRFCILRLENVSDFEEAKEADLISKRFVKKLELRWTDMRVGRDYTEEEKILQHLQPPLQLEELTVLNYCGSKLPSWIDNPSYGFLFDISLSGCRNCQLLPSLGELPSLQFLHIKEMNELKRIDHHFRRKGSDHQYHGLFPKLEKLTIEFMPKLVEWIGVQHGDFPLLQKLKVEHCPKLISLPFQSCLYSLKHLELCYCPNIMSLPDKDVTDSLEFLLIEDCPDLKQRCHKGEGQDWGKIAHVPNIFFDDEKIT